MYVRRTESFAKAFFAKSTKKKLPVYFFLLNLFKELFTTMQIFTRLNQILEPLSIPPPLLRVTPSNVASAFAGDENCLFELVFYFMK